MPPMKTSASKLFLAICLFSASLSSQAAFIDERAVDKAVLPAALVIPPATATGAAPATALAPGASGTPSDSAAGFVLRGGEPIHTDIAAWAKRHGWELYWLHRASWKTLRETRVQKLDVTDAISEVVDILRDEGKPIMLRISEGNKVMEVLSTEVRND